MTQEGVIKSEVEANKTLFTLRLPEQPHITPTPLRPPAREVHIVAFTKDNYESEGLRNAFNLLDVLYQRGVTDPYVLKVILEATGHPEKTTDYSGVPSESSISGDERAPH